MFAIQSVEMKKFDCIKLIFNEQTTNYFMRNAYNTCLMERRIYDRGKFEYFSVNSPTAPISLSHRAFNRICVNRIFTNLLQQKQLLFRNERETPYKNMFHAKSET